MYFINNQNVGILLLFVGSHVGVKMAESFAANTVSRFRSPKTGEGESKLLQGSIPKSTTYKTKWAIKGKTGDSIYKLGSMQDTIFVKDYIY